MGPDVGCVGIEGFGGSSRVGCLAGPSASSDFVKPKTAEDDMFQMLIGFLAALLLCNGAATEEEVARGTYYVILLEAAKRLLVIMFFISPTVWKQA